ncbi:vitamin B12-dependent ribonucleotide reductase [Candidatus Pacearchaeota archaeon]|nr:vitamin B12-dependent ribonucleotide reductase [Candidatus Pacearchaeota archaeon]
MTPERMHQLTLGTFSPERVLTVEGKNPFHFDIFGNPITWISDDVKLTDDMGKAVFTQPAVKRPDFWSALAIKVVANKYFWGDMLKGERENSVEQLIGRVARYIRRQAIKQGYFNETQAQVLHDEIIAICVNQLAVFNSPVWFNAGIQEYNAGAGGVSSWKWDAQSDTIMPTFKTDDRPQCSACFIQSIQDTMESIMEVQVAEANLFKAGSGTGTNRSPLRSSREKVTGGGKASGPLSFMKGYDAYAGVVKSGGKTRRAAKMEILNIDHPDILDFITAKQMEEKKAWALIEHGYSGGMNGDAYGSVFFQNSNMSVRVSDEFMVTAQQNGEWWTKMVKTGEPCEKYAAKDLLLKIAEGTWLCGDPGMQYDTTINKWHTCKNTARINASNPCSEYMFIDDSACNLASINLMKFRRDDGSFDVARYKHVVKILAICMDLLVDGSSYPTAKICRNSRDYRPLGMGYANLGALLMSWGLPYDSDEGRAVAAALTALMCGEAYLISSELASLVGPFPGFQKNKEPMLAVMNMHRDAVKGIDVAKMPSFLRELTNHAWDSWSDAVETGTYFGFRNSQMTVLAPTGTIAFMMDCDTTGVEPDIALVKYKVLSGGGMLKIVNRSVPLALRTLGYSEDAVSRIIDFIDKQDTIEGAPDVRPEHFAVFDCAFKPAKGTRSIQWSGHVKMMAAGQPFISGAISKTVNLPETSTVTDIAEAYALSWQLGLKAVAIYRENSKRSQPLNTKKTEGEMVKKDAVAPQVQLVKLERKKLPQTRQAITHKFEIAGHEGYLTIGLYDDGKPGELFLTMHKVGSTVNGLVDAWATSISMNLQFGIPVDVLFNKFRHQKFEPAGFVKGALPGDLDAGYVPIRTASSIVDYISQFMLSRFGPGAGGLNVSLTPVQPGAVTQASLSLTEVMQDETSLSDGQPAKVEEQASLKTFGNEGLVCPQCGGPAKRLGNCAMVCTSCKQTTRSGCGE